MNKTESMEILKMFVFKFREEGQPKIVRRHLETHIGNIKHLGEWATLDKYNKSNANYIISDSKLIWNTLVKQA